MNTAQPTLFPLEFNPSLRVEPRPERLTVDAGAVLLRRVIHRLRYTRDLARHLRDTRNPDLITHPLEEMLNTALLMFAQGWRDEDDADELRDDPVFRLSVSTRRGLSPLAQRPDEERRRDKNPEHPDGLASQPTLSRMLRMLSPEDNRRVLRDTLLLKAAHRIKANNRGHRLRYVTLDVDSLPISVSGHQPGSAYNGHYHERVYHPLIASIAELGDILDATLREGNVHTANGSVDFILPLIDLVEKHICQVANVRFDAGFPEENVLSALENRSIGYAARIKNNPVLDRKAAPFLKLPPGRPPKEPRVWFYEDTYQAESWSHARRVVLVVLERRDEPQGELFPHHFWLITNWTMKQIAGDDLLEHYRERGTAEGHQGELMSVLDPALHSSPRPKTHYRHHVPKNLTPSGDSFAINEVILLLNVMAYNLTHTLRVMTETATKEGWSLRRVRERVLKVAARVVLHGRRAIMVVNTTTARHWKSLWPKFGTLDLAEA